RGRIAMARALAEGHLGLTPDLLRHEDSCLACEACTAVCPAGVWMEPIQSALRAAVEPVRRRSLPGRLVRAAVYGGLFARPALLRAVSRLGWLYQRSGAQRLARAAGLLRLLGLAEADRLMPRFSSRFLVPKGQRWRPDGGVRRRVALLTGCIMSTAFAEVHGATVRVLTAAGCEVTAPREQVCCGALQLHAGWREAARRQARRNIDAFERDGADAVVANAAGCGAAMKGYPHLLADDPAYAERARRFAARVRDLTELLDELGPPLPLGPVAATVTYQDACHLAHAQGVLREPRRLLASVPGLRLVELPESATCCGSAGVYNVTQPAMAARLGRRKARRILETGAEAVVSTNPGCILQMRAHLEAAGANVRVLHVAQVLDEAVRRGREPARTAGVREADGGA
ncbi:MAG TPA: (Fe-S)-binding protein, partial [Dehalococcoidia bacterium]